MSVLTENKSQHCPCAESINWKHSGATGFGKKKRECNMLTGNGGNKGGGEAEKQEKKEIARKR